MTRDLHPRMTTVTLALVVLALLTTLTLAALAGVILSRRDAALSVARAAYKQDIQNWHEKLEGCGRSVDDRRGSINLLTLSAVANEAVADNGVNTSTVRRARGREAAAQRAAVRSLEQRVPPAFTCITAYPKPVAPAGVRPLP